MFVNQSNKIVILMLLSISATYATKELPDPKLTPGVARTTNQSEICDPKFRTGKYRKTTPAMKREVYARYHVQKRKGFWRNTEEVDHLLPLEAGGADTVENLWIQPAPSFHEKDILENHLRHIVCVEKRLTLKEAQECIVTDWKACKAKLGL